MFRAKTRGIRREAVARCGNRNEIEIKDPPHPGLAGSADGCVGMTCGGFDGRGDLPDQFTW